MLQTLIGLTDESLRFVEVSESAEVVSLSFRANLLIYYYFNLKRRRTADHPNTFFLCSDQILNQYSACFECFTCFTFLQETSGKESKR